MGAGTIEAAAVGHDGEAVLGQAASPRFENARDLGHHLEGWEMPAPSLNYETWK